MHNFAYAVCTWPSEGCNQRTTPPAMKYRVRIAAFSKLHFDYWPNAKSIIAIPRWRPHSRTGTGQLPHNSQHGMHNTSACAVATVQPCPAMTRKKCARWQMFRARACARACVCGCVYACVCLSGRRLIALTHASARTHARCDGAGPFACDMADASEREWAVSGRAHGRTYCV